MQFSIRISKGSPLKLKEGLIAGIADFPHHWMKKWNFNDDGLTISIEEYSKGPFTIRIIMMRLYKQMELIWKDHLVGLKITWVISGVMMRRSRQYIKKSIEEERMRVSKPGEYKLIDIICTLEKIKEYDKIFPGVEGLLKNGDDRMVSPAVAGILYAIDQNPYDGTVLESYVENKIEELMLVLFHETTNTKNRNDEAVDVIEMDAVTKAESLIMKDISKHYTIKELSKMVGLNQVRLKVVFKEVYGEGMFERLQNARMQYAHELLLDTDKPMKEIASLAGYKYLTSFVNAFRSYYDYTPGSLRR